MHGCEGEKGKRSRHMWSAPTRGKLIVTATADGSSSSLTSSANSFCKGGRKISVGDCALFRPPQDCQPFIGIIRWLTVGKGNKLNLGVNRLYRSVELELGKGFLLEAAPNEIFYSFHKDEIPAASLLHPCKVAFLPKGIELPSAIASFVCRRVYDITNKCLWWLTDQDYIDERQEEVVQLLYKTRIAMQDSGRSPKPMNSPTSTSQLKSGSDSGSSFPSQVKTKKRERVDQGSESMKRERKTKTDDGDSGNFIQESILKTEITKITEKGGLVESERVEKLVQLMVPDRDEKKIDLVDRSMLAGVIAATDKFDCLSRFVQLRGLPVLDEWLQEVHRGKIGDGSGSKDSDKSVEEFLFVLLRALDKLPVNLQALQMCNIGKSVNHLRMHKNMEVQKKARGLVDTWKKRVEAEMNISDAKSGSSQGVPWSARSHPPEVAQGGNRHSGVSSDVALRSSSTQLSTSKTAPVKLVQGESASRSASASPGSVKSVLSPASANANSKDGQPCGNSVGGASDAPLVAPRDEKSSSSSPSHNNSQSCSSELAKTGGCSGKEDARSSTAGSINVNKMSSCSSRHRKLTNGFTGPIVSGGQRETGSTRSSLHKTSASKKVSQSGLTCEKELDGPVAEGGSHKLIVKIPNRGRSPAQSASGGSFDDPSIMNSRASSPVLSEKHNQLDHCLKEKCDSYRANVTAVFNTESWQSNDFKDVLTGADEADRSPATATATDEEGCKTGGSDKKLLELSKAASSSSGNENKSGNLQDASFSSINALIASCVKYSGDNASVSAADDLGMNLLASVAAGEIFKSDLVVPTGSPQTTTALVEQSCPRNGVQVKSQEAFVQDQVQSSDSIDDEHEKQHTVSGDLGANIGNRESDLLVEGKGAGDQNRHITSSDMDTQNIADTCLQSKVKLNGNPASASLTSFPESTRDKATDSEADRTHKRKVVGEVYLHENHDEKCDVGDSLLFEDKINGDLSVEVEMEADEKSSSSPSTEVDVKGKNCMIGALNSSVQTAENSPAVMMQLESVKGTDEAVVHPSGSGIDGCPENVDERKDGKDDENHVNESQDQSNERESNALAKPENGVLGSDVPGHNGEYVENSKSKEVREEKILHKATPSISSQETEQCLGCKGSKVTLETEECTSTTADSSLVLAAGAFDIGTKVEFDLNEGLNADDGKCWELNGMKATGASAPVQLISPVACPASSVSGSIPTLITVAAAKGLFLPPEDLVKCKMELGWRGSATTSAFRPAEPRKALEMPLGTTSAILPDTTAGKPNRPPLDIDLNIPDERILEDIASHACGRQTETVSLPSNDHESARHKMLASAPIHCSGGLDLDLNLVDEASNVGNCSTSNSHRLDMPLVPVKPLSGSSPNSKVNVCRDFDLNNGPAVDEVSGEPSLFIQNVRSGVPSQPPLYGLRMSNTEIGNLSPWYPSTGNTYSAVTISSIMPEKGDPPFSIVATNGPQRMLGPSTGGSPFGSDVYRGPVLSSSPAVAFPPALARAPTPAPFQYPVFPFGSSFPLPSASFSGGSATYLDSTSGGRLCFPAVSSQFPGPPGTVSSHYPRPYAVSLAEGSNSTSAEGSRRWGRQGLDLNTGPGGPELEGRDETIPLAPRQFSLASSQSLAEEQARMFQVAGGLLKGKESEGGWDGYKRSSWQ
ncbi:BAH domain [Quillaja saponaria]|uniref:BAH domain n=1 Tax=Quillaja saponaria TaxID=32244 RepID=A0AAD7KTT2_QUISA|nr:BAH domain [Quillaja saponaria]